MKIAQVTVHCDGQYNEMFVLDLRRSKQEAYMYAHYATHFITALSIHSLLLFSFFLRDVVEVVTTVT